MFSWQVTLSSALMSGAIAWIARQVALRPMPPPAWGGYCGQCRQLAWADAPRLEMVLRFCGGLTSSVLHNWAGSSGRIATLLARIERYQQRLLMGAGYPLGLSTSEVSFISLALASLGAGLGLMHGWESGTWAWGAVGFAVGASLVHFRIAAVMQDRFLQLSHQLPQAIDLTAMSMNAGLDFPGALRRIAAGQRSVVAEEMRQVLRALELGVTRTAALQAFEERCPIGEVRDLVRAVVLAEKKGSSVAEALRQQARSSRQRRSVRAEEAAARAGVLLILPLMLLMGCILILLAGPIVLRGSAW